jgi:hypothetical protein
MVIFAADFCKRISFEAKQDPLVIFSRMFNLLPQSPFTTSSQLANQQQPEVSPRRQTRAVNRRGREGRTLRFDKRIDLMGFQDLIQPLMERIFSR